MNPVQGTIQTLEVPGPARSRKAIFLKAAGFGAGFGVAASLLLALGIWWSNRPKAWSESGITAKPAELYMIQTTDQVAFQFRYAFTNHTGSEYTLPSADMGALMRKLPGDTALDKLERSTWDGTIRIPPSQSIAVTFTVPFRFADFNASGSDMTEEKFAEFARRRLKDIDGLTFFDYAGKYKIQMAKKWDTPKRQETKANSLMAPDKGDVFDKVHACEEATRLAERCTRANVSIASAPWAKYGGWPEKLRDLPTPPPGYTLDPTPETCTIAAEWQNYCKAKVK